MFNWLTKRFKKKAFQPFNQTDVQTDSVLFQQVSNFLQPTVRTFIYYYQQVEPLADAVDRVGDKVSEVQAKLINTTEAQFVSDHWSLNLLDNPNTNVEYCEFMKASSNYLTLTGNLYWILTISPSLNKILELFVVPSDLINTNRGSDGRVSSYFYTPNGPSITFSRRDIGRNIRYFSFDGRQELIHVKEYNPNGKSFEVIGTSRLNAILYAILQYRAASIHNLALLDNGVRPSGIFKTRDDATQDQMASLRAEIENMYSSSGNAGRPIASNMVEDFVSFLMNNVDMDFLNLKLQVQQAIYRRLKIPLVLIDTDAATFNNYETALTALYDDAIIPQFQRMMNVLTMYFTFYDPAMGNLKLTFDPLTIPALRDRRINELTNITALNVMSDNEIRNLIGMQPYTEGDEIWKPTSLAPIDLVLEDNGGK